jgi:hypothetical protein
MVLVHTATEDELSESVACRLIRDYVHGATLGLKLRKGGAGYLKSSFQKFSQMAAREHVLMLADLDRGECAPALIKDWVGEAPPSPKLLFRVPVREIEAWILADRPGVAALFGVSEASLPPDPDTLDDPKQALLNAARRAVRTIRSDLLRTRGTVASQGLGYNRVLSNFVETEWDPDRARQRSPSLNRTMARLAELGPA